MDFKLFLLLSAAPLYQGSPQRIFSNIRTEDLAVFYTKYAIAEQRREFSTLTVHLSKIDFASI